MKRGNSSFQVEKAEDSPGFLLWQVTNLWQREIKKTLEEYGLTHAQFVLLASTHWLTLNGEELTQTALSLHTKIDPMTTSTVLRTLQKKGFLKREEHSTDTRAKTVTLTGKGLEITKRAVKTVEKFDNDFFQTLGVRSGEFNEILLALLTGNTGR